MDQHTVAGDPSALPSHSERCAPGVHSMGRDPRGCLGTLPTTLVSVPSLGPGIKFAARMQNENGVPCLKTAKSLETPTAAHWTEHGTLLDAGPGSQPWLLCKWC